MSAGSWKPGTSGNPAGRPKGIVDRRTRLNQALHDDADALLAVAKAKALEGDPQMLNLLLSRLMPALRPEAALAQFELDVSAPLSKQMDQVLAAVADGRLTIDNAQDIAKILQTRAEIAALEGGGDQAAALVEAFKQLSQVLPR